MRVRLLIVTLVFALPLAACGGGGGGTPPAGSSSPSSEPTTPAPPPSVTIASGTVVNDANGSPLAGVRVVVMPWATCGPTPSPAASIAPESDGCPTPLPAPQATTNASGAFTLGPVPNGRYLLVIGADAVATVPPGYTTPPANCGGPCPTPSPVAGTPMQATVHDDVTLTGGSQTLRAPTLPSVPAGYTAPSWETNGDYRLATLNASTEMPCLIAWQYERAQNDLAGSSVDEWLLENVRAGNAYAQVAAAGSTIPSISTGGTTTSGGVACAADIEYQFTAPNSFAIDPRTLWFAGQYAIYSAFGGTDNEAAGLAEFPIDPRSFTDPNHPSWP